MNSAEGQKALESMVGQMLIAKLTQLGASNNAIEEAVSQLSFDDIRHCLSLTETELKQKFAALLA